MQSTVCRGCQRPLLEENSGRNIFKDDSLIKSLSADGSYDGKWCMKLQASIELITGHKVTKEEKLPLKVCEICFQNIESFVNFRLQLLRTREILLSSYQDSKSENNLFRNNQNLRIAKEEKPLKNAEEPNSSQNESEFSSNVTKPKTSDDLINVDENSSSLDVDSSSNDGGETNDSVVHRLQNDQDNNNLDDSDSSLDNAAAQSNAEEIPTSKQSEHDIESEIDVCSGEDDDVLELDVQKRKNETVEINSSSESDIEVCDYEPSSKRALLLHL